LDVRFVRVLVSTNVGSMIRLHGVKVFDEEYADDAWYEWMVWTSPGCNFSRVVATTCQCRCYESQTTKQVLISTKTRITVLLICNLAFMSFYTSDFTIDGKMCPMMATNNRASSLLCPICPCVHLRQPHLSSASLVLFGQAFPPLMQPSRRRLTMYESSLFPHRLFFCQHTPAPISCGCLLSCTVGASGFGCYLI
jgi:hypothetical protein